MRLYAVIFVLVLSFGLGGCINSGSEGGSDPISTGLNYYYDEFADVAIPREMTPEKKETFITFSADGVKLGTQIVSGRVEMASLVNAMQGHMARDGWSLRSVFRSTRSVMIFERADRICSIYIADGVIDTTMLIFVSPKLPDGALQYSVPPSTSTEPLPPTDPAVRSSSSSSAPIGAPIGAPASSPAVNDGNVTVYPANGYTGGTMAQ